KAVVEYDTDLYERETAKRMMGHFQRLLQGIVRDGEQAIGAVPMLGAEERQQLLLEWNQTTAATPASCLHELFEEQVERTPDAVAVTFEEQQLSYGELNQRANQLAHHLRSVGVGPEVLVGVLMERSVELVVSLLAVLKAGGAYVGMDAHTPEQRLLFTMEDAGVKLLLTQRQTITALPEYSGQVVYVEKEWEEFAEESQENLANALAADNLAYVIYTSGSTGQPKGVLISHRAICNHLHWRQTAYPLTGSDRFLHKASVGFDISVWEIFGPLLAGSELLLAKPGGQQESSYLTRLIAERKVTVAHFGPAMLQVWLQEPDIGQCKDLKRVFCGGEPLTVEQRNSFFERFNAGLCHQYGPTEATVDALVWDCQPDDGGVIPLGRPIANMRAYVLDERLQPVPIGVAGELHLAGAGLARGYLNRADLTSSQFIPDPFSEKGGERLYKTGDQARYLADGNIEYLGRLDEQVKIRGYRIELGEIESVLSEHPVVRQSVTIAREDVAGDKRLVSYIVAAAEDPVEIGELRIHLKQKLPDYMIPSAFVLLDALPLMPNGKIERRALPEPEAPRIDHQPSTTTQTPIEEIITGICAHLLKVEELSGEDNFFELGGHSLLATRLISRLRDSLSIEIPVRWVFQTRTLGELAERVEEQFAREKAVAGPRIEAICRRGEDGDSLPLSFGQQRLWFLDQLEPGNPVYN
ncbi:MAG: amino acid adenylation domain-containing protein, partial [Acidobacteriota bacterium]